jgi:hypothetical protein
MQTHPIGAWAAALVLAALCAVLPPSARGAEGKRITGPQLVTILQDLGYRATLDEDGIGEPMVRTGMGGYDVFVYFYECEAAACGSLQFVLGLDLEDGASFAAVDAFNRDKRWARAHLDDERDPFLRMDFEVLHADHRAHIASHVDVWEGLVADFASRMRGDAGGEVAVENRPPPPRLRLQ